MAAMPFIGQGQWIAGYPVADFLVSATHPNCDQATAEPFVLGPPDDKCWVNMVDNSVMTGLFGSTWADQTGEELLLETSYHRDNYNVRLILAGGGFSSTRTVAQAEWTQITDTVWTHLFATCDVGMFGSDRFILPLDFNADFGVTGATLVEGIEITFLQTTGAPDLAGVYIISEDCPPISLGQDFVLCDGLDSLLDVSTAGATYLWQDNSTASSFLITGPGSYSVTITTADCVSTDDITVTAQTTPIVDLGVDTTLCAGAFLILDAGTFPGATYTWSGSFLSQFIFVDQAGTYWVNVTVNGCSGTDTILVDFGTGVSAALGPDTILCAGQSITLDAGSAGDSYEWQDGSTGQTFFTDQTGDYWVDITTGTCVTSDTIQVDVIPYPIVDLGSDTTLCSGESILLSIFNPGGTTNWNDGSVGNSIPTGTAGWYWAEASVAQCSVRDSLFLDFYDLPSGVVTGISPFCANANTSLEFNLTGTAPFTLSYSHNSTPQADLNTNALTISLPVDQPGIYQLTNVSDANCDSGMGNTILLTTYPTITASAGFPSVVCEDETVTLTAAASGGQENGYSFLWSDEQGFFSTENPLNLTLTEDLSLSLVANDACDLPSDPVSVSTAVQAYPEPMIEALNDTVCLGQLVIFQQPSPAAGTTCLWTFEDGSQDGDCGPINHVFFQAGYSSVSLTLTTSAGCAESLVLDSAIYVLADPEADFKFEKQEGNIFSPGIQFLNQSEFSSDFEWSFGDFAFSEQENPFHLYPSTITDSYLACLTAFNSLGCPDTTCKIVTIDPEFLVSIPNAFSPDGDNVNDYFVPVFNDIPLAEYSLFIFDRNGRIVFESVEQGERWDGSGAVDEDYFTTDGVYHYKLVIREFNRPEKREFIGFVTVLR